MFGRIYEEKIGKRIKSTDGLGYLCEQVAKKRGVRKLPLGQSNTNLVGRRCPFAISKTKMEDVNRTIDAFHEKAL